MKNITVTLNKKGAEELNSVNNKLNNYYNFIPSCTFQEGQQIKIPKIMFDLIDNLEELIV